MIGVQLITGAVGEELGWRGYLLPRLRVDLGAIGAGWTMAVLWSAWHVPAFFTPGMPHPTMPMMWALTTVLLFGVFLAFVFFRAGETIGAPLLAHVSFNIMSGLGGAQLSSPVLWRTLAGTFAVVAFITLVASPRPAPGPSTGGGGPPPSEWSLPKAWHSRPPSAGDAERPRSPPEAHPDLLL